MSARRPALSPSRANDFKQCPLMFRLRVIDKLPEPPSPAAELGTLVHTVLEELYDSPAEARTERAAIAALPDAWRRQRDARPELADLHTDAAAERDWLAGAADRLRAYFALENPQRLEPAAREEFLEYQLEDGPLLRGVLDRVDVAPDGSIRVVDYKTGKSPSPRFSSSATFQMRFYALLVERLRGRAPAVLQLLYLRDGQTIALHPTPEDLDKLEHEVRELWNDIMHAAENADFRPQKSALCPWCSFQEFCPEFGGQAPPLSSADALAALGGTRED